MLYTKSNMSEIIRNVAMHLGRICSLASRNIYLTTFPLTVVLCTEYLHGLF